ncbi:MAG: PilZ domain-containing protein [Thermodesulfobacteriota bacterium]
MERRKNTRVDFHATADVLVGGREFRGLAIRDLGLRGVYLLGLEGCRIGDPCQVRLFLSGTSSEVLLSMQGRIMRIEDDGAGLRFDELDLDTFTHLKNIVYYNADDPDQLKPEEEMAEDVPDGQFVDQNFE